MIHICVGRECNDYIDCDKKDICKYSRNKRFPMNIFNLFLLYKRDNRLSGTSKCPYHKSRNYTFLIAYNDSGLLFSFLLI